MKFAGMERPKFTRRVCPSSSAQCFGNSRRVKTREREMRRKLTGFARAPQFFHACVDLVREWRKIRRSFNTRPEHAQTSIVREKAEPTQTQFDAGFGANFRERSADRVEFACVDVADEFQRHVQIL